METNLADYLTIDPNALSIINATTDIYMGPFHKIHPQTESLAVDDAATATDSSDSFLVSFPSVSDVLNQSRQQTGVSVADDKRQAFDRAWCEQMHKLFQATESPTVHPELLDYERTGLSNGYALGLQVMVLSPGKCFKIHAHPNIEFEYTMLGTLREFRCCHFRAKAHDLAAKPAAVSPDASDAAISPEPPPPLVGPEIDASFMFEERSCPQNHCMLNETGSIHQSFTSPHQACAILVLWSQCHANSHPSRVFTTDPRLRPSAGW